MSVRLDRRDIRACQRNDREILPRVGRKRVATLGCAPVTRWRSVDDEKSRDELRGELKSDRWMHGILRLLRKGEGKVTEEPDKVGRIE